MNVLVTSLTSRLLLSEVAEKVCQMEKTRSTGLSTKLAKGRLKIPSSSAHLMHRITQPLVTSQTIKSHSSRAATSLVISAAVL